VELGPGARGGGQRILLLTAVPWLCALAALSWRAGRNGPQGPAWAATSCALATRM